MRVACLRKDWKADPGERSVARETGRDEREVAAEAADGNVPTSAEEMLPAAGVVNEDRPVSRPAHPAHVLAPVLLRQPPDGKRW